MKIKLLLCIVLAILLSSCSAVNLPIAPIQPGEVQNLFQGSAQYIIDACLSGTCFTSIFTNGKVVVYSMPFLDGYAFTIVKDGTPLNQLPTELCGANLVNCTTWIAFKAWMDANGYTMTVIRNLPQAVTSSMTLWSVGITLPMEDVECIMGLCTYEY